MERMTKYRRDRSRYRGVALAEAAIVLSLLMMLTLGALEYGWLFINAQQVTNAARQGARIAILPDNGASGRARTAITQLLTNAGLADDNPVIDVPEASSPQGGVNVKTIRVTVSTANLRLTHWDLLPVPPRIGCVITMAQEGTGP
jgi:Flp pilus assembly protein TadG